MKSKITLKQAITLLSLLIFFLAGKAQSALDKRIDQLVDAMTTQEKINQLINCSFGGTPANTRLSIPGLTMDDGPHGVRFAADRNGRSATAFPTGIAMAATWDEGIARQVGEAMGWEFWAFNRNQQLGPCIDICRDPRGGRSAESSGEDPYLAGHIGKAVAIGIQQTPVIATVKHFMGESKQVNRHKMNVVCTDRWLMDVGGYNFRTVVQEAGVLSVMGAYNLMNGEKCCESATMQTKILRERWGYPFYVVSDWDAIWNSDKALKAGTDICMGSNKYANDLPAMVEKGLVTNADLDRAVKHVLKSKILNGMLDYFPRGEATAAKTTSIEATNRLAAQKSIILLKNEVISHHTLLPLKKDGLKIALIGPNARAENLNCFGSSETFPPYAISIWKGIEAKIGTSQLTYAKGCDVNSSSKDGFEAAKALAAKADIVIFAGGLDATQEGEGFDWGTDRKDDSIALPGQQQALINELAAVNPNIVAIIQSGGVCSLNNCIGNIKGLIYSFYAAQEAGNAIADVLFGDYNPAGRMPVTMPKHDSDLPSWDEETFRRFTENMDGGYRWYDEKNILPEFAFGAGLSYTQFSYKNLKVPVKINAGAPFTISVDITNSGKVEGEEVAQLYLKAPSTPERWMPKKQLRGFKRIHLKPGETATVHFELTADDFYYWDGTQYQTQTGDFILKVGGASDRLVVSAPLRLEAGSQKPDLKITQLYTMPRYPLQGQEVSFYTLVKNQGNAAASDYQLNFNVDGNRVAETELVHTSIAPGQVQLIASKGSWIANKTGKSKVGADISCIKGEWDQHNNQYSRSFEIFDPQVDPSISNLAYRKQITATSEAGNNQASSIVDGDMATRWESDKSDNQTISVDLSLIAAINNISIYWEGAYAQQYKVEGSLDGSSWTLIREVTNGKGGIESSPGNDLKARYIRITMAGRTSIDGKKYGFSIYELVVNGKILQQFPTVQLAPVESQLYLPYAKTILNGSQSGNPLKKEKLTYRWQQISGPVKANIKDSTDAATTVKFDTEGEYSFRFTVGNETGSNHSDFKINVQKTGAKADLAFMKPTECSGVESGFTGSDMAVDGSGSTRWSSAFKDGEWWIIDLQHPVKPSAVEIVWEGAYAKNFNVEISSDRKQWIPYYSNNSFAGGRSLINNDKSLSGRYLKVNCIQRATQYGSSFYTFSVHGDFASGNNTAPIARVEGVKKTNENAKLDGSRSYDADKETLHYKWEEVAGPSAVYIENSTSPTTLVTGLKPGDYFFKLTVDDGKDADFELVKFTCQ